MLHAVIPQRKIESAKDSRGRVTHWNCSVCEWTTLGFTSPSTAMALKAISDTFDAHNCANHKKGKRVRLS